ncbi:MAG: holin family protein, partial [Gemmatimonadota bacterium]|nr:holin family protein [Gemmatimonadota bacterium]
PGGKLLSAVAGIGRKVSGYEDVDDMADAVMSDPEMFASFRESLVSLEREETARFVEQHKTAQAELASLDVYVRRWRPTMGYVITACFAWIFLVAGGRAAVGDIDGAVKFIGAMAELEWVIMAALGVLGVYVKQRSNDKRVAAGAPGLVESVLNLVRRP